MVAYSRVRGGAKREYLPAHYTERPLEEREDSLRLTSYHCRAFSLTAKSLETSYIQLVGFFLLVLCIQMPSFDYVYRMDIYYLCYKL